MLELMKGGHSNRVEGGHSEAQRSWSAHLEARLEGGGHMEARRSWAGHSEAGLASGGQSEATVVEKGGHSEAEFEGGRLTELVGGHSEAAVVG